eukprot:SAG22_NODE_492_length_9824_cov_12.256864_5_plen_214_part_00
MAAQGPVVPKQLNYADVLPVAIESRSNKRTFEPTNGNSFSPSGNKIIRLNINSDNLADFTHSYMQATLVNTSTKNLALDTGIPWISRMQILSGGQELESCDAYNRLHSMLQAVQGNPAQAGQFSLTQKENFPSAPVPVAAASIGAEDSFAATAHSACYPKSTKILSLTRIPDLTTSRSAPESNLLMLFSPDHSVLNLTTIGACSVSHKVSLVV